MELERERGGDQTQDTRVRYWWQWWWCKGERGERERGGERGRRERGGRERERGRRERGVRDYLDFFFGGGGGRG